MASAGGNSIWKGKFKSAPTKKDSKPKGKPGIKGKNTKKKAAEETPRKRVTKRHRKYEIKATDAEKGEEAPEVVPREPVARGPPTAAAKAKVAKLKSRQRQLSGAEFEAAKELSSKVATCGPTVQADWLWGSYQRHTEAIDLERNASGLESKHLVALPNGAGPLEQGLKSVEPRWQQELCSTSGRGPGEISALIISPAALGCTSVIKACPEFNRRCRIAKLFAKHFKVPEQVEALRTEPACIAAGTPNRLAKLIEEDALKLKKLKWIVVDVRLDVKGRTMLDQPEVCADWWGLWDKHLKAAVVGQQAGAKVVLFGGSP